MAIMLPSYGSDVGSIPTRSTTRKTMRIEYLEPDDLLEQFITRIKCNHYCPLQCTHETEFDEDELRNELRRRLDINWDT
jgi:hypothetical protein